MTWTQRAWLAWWMTLVGIGLALDGVGGSARAAENYRSHPPLRRVPPPSQRPVAKGPVRLVDPVRGKDEGDGSAQNPWRTINHALSQLKAGDTLYLKGGVYHENVYCAVAGTKEAPITIRSYPGEQAILDGGLREFQETPAAAWVPEPRGAPDEFRSARPYRNIRDVVGLFGDSMIGLQTYWHVSDLRATNELWIDDPEKKRMILPIYCGPGLWYDKQTGFIHARLAHTHTHNPQVADYRGETDPRKLPLVISPFNSVPLFVDQAMHIRFQDLVIRGGGHNTVVLQFGVDLDFDNVTVFGGSYCLRARGTGPLRMVNSALHGMIAPWGWRSENGLYTYTAREYDPFLPPDKGNVRNIARLPTHAVLVTEGSYEFEIFHYPHNHDWDISASEFTDGHDGVYLSGNNIRFHHNWVDNMQDDGIYLSSPTPGWSDQIAISQNLITRVFTAFACNTIGGPTGNIYIYRNLVDLRQGVRFARPTPKKPEGNIFSGHIFLVHGRELLGIESIYFYQNTFVSPASRSGGYALRTWVSTTNRTSRRIFNNIFVYLDAYRESTILRAPEHDIQMDGNLHWCPAPDARPPAGFLEKVRQCPASLASKAKYPPGWEANSFVGDPRFVAFDSAPTARADYQLQKSSPAIGKGVVLPAAWEDPLRPQGESRPDIGALPLGSPPPTFGRQQRLGLPITGSGPVAAPTPPG